MEKITLRSVGALKEHPEVPEEWLISEPISVPLFDGKKLNFIFDGYENDENFFSEADEAVLNFLAKDKTYRLELSHLIFRNYIDVFEECREDENLTKVEDEKEVWKLIHPREIYVNRRVRRDKDIYLQIHCECEWEIEHGLQIVFRQGRKVTRVSSIDGHLTEADAESKFDSEDELLSKF